MFSKTDRRNLEQRKRMAVVKKIFNMKDDKLRIVCETYVPGNLMLSSVIKDKRKSGYSLSPWLAIMDSPMDI